MGGSPQGRMQLNDFQSLVGQTFEADCNPKPVALRLVEASPLGMVTTPDTGPFILVFHTPPDTYLVDGIYKMQAKGFNLSEINIGSMVAPAGSEPGYYYQAVFN